MSAKSRTEIRPNVRLRPNVVCTRLHAMDESENDLSLADGEFARRIAYWELLELTRACPLRFSSHMCRLENLSIRQRVELEKYLDPGPNVRHLWPDTSNRGFRPFVPGTVAHPFYEEYSTFDDDERPSDVVAKTVVDLHRDVHHAPALAVEIDESAAANEDELLHGGDSAADADVDEQDGIISAPLLLNQLVVAPPGTGKTHVLVKRLRYLVANGWIENPAREVLVLSFSRAAVAEVSRRIESELKSSAHDDLRYIQIRTFDSYATRMLTRGAGDRVWLENGYQRRIEQFRTAVKDRGLPDAAHEEVAAIRYLVIDELQDLVGARARMSLQMIKTVVQQGGTVLLLGDPAQAIYDWQLPEGDKMTSSEFLRQATSLAQDSGYDFRQKPLRRYRRFENSEILRLVVRCRRALGEDGRQPDMTELTNHLQSLAEVPFSHLRQAADSMESAAVLTRTNLEAFQISQWCKEQCIPHRVERGSSGRYWPAWIARLCFEFQMDRMPLEVARRRWESLVGEHESGSFDQAISFLIAHGLFGDDVLDLQALSTLIDKSQPQCAWPPDDTPNLVISTIHRSKGLEFDRVLLLKAQHGNFNSGDADEGHGEARLLYVAATRAKKNLALLMRDHTILRRGNKHCKGFPRSKLSHFHLFNRQTESNFLLVDGLDEIDRVEFLQRASQQAIVESQNELWENCTRDSSQLSVQRVGGDLCWTRPSGGTLCKASQTLSGSVATLGRTYRGGDATAVLALRCVPVADSASVSFPWEGGSSVEKRLGKAKLAILPVVYGLAAIEFAD